MVLVKINYASVSPIIKITYDETPVYIKTSVNNVYAKVVYGTSIKWGDIEGTLSDQTDLQNALDDKVPYTGATANVGVTPEFVQSATGAQVHRFTWLTDDLIGELPKEWNWLDVEYDWNPHAKLVHYTLGTPCFHEFSDQGNFANEWHKERIYTEYCLQRGLNG